MDLELVYYCKKQQKKTGSLLFQEPAIATKFYGTTCGSRGSFCQRIFALDSTVW